MLRKCRPIAARKMVVWGNELSRKQKDAIITYALKEKTSSANIAKMLSDAGIIRKSLAGSAVSRMLTKLQRAGIIRYDATNALWVPCHKETL